MAPNVLTGLAHLLRHFPGRVRGRRAGLLCHAASVNEKMAHAADLLIAAGARLLCLLGPEHGVRGEAQDMAQVGSAQDPFLGIPLFSLYGGSTASLRPRPEHLRGLDLLLMDLQDVGSRYYTFIWTMVLTVEACAEAGVEVLLLDRPNPLGGLMVEGPGIEPGFTSFVGLHPVPVRHGMTAGELVRMAASERGTADHLEVIPMLGWHRDQLFSDTSLPWVMPSPNMPSCDTAAVYPGSCLLEGTNLSEGRGTTRPFEILGAPWVDGRVLARALEQDDLFGARFRPLSFCPTFHKHHSCSCGGIQIHVTDPRRFLPLRTGVALLRQFKRLWPERFHWRREAYEFEKDALAIDLLAGGTWLREGIEAGASLEDLTAGWAGAEGEFCQRRAEYLLYDV